MSDGDDEKPLAVSALRNRFEKLALDTVIARPKATTSTSKANDSNDLLSVTETHQRSLSDNDAEAMLRSVDSSSSLRSATSSSDLKQRRPPPPPPATRSPKPSSPAPLASPLLRPASTSVNSAPIVSSISQVIEKPSLTSRKPPPPPVAALRGQNEADKEDGVNGFGTYKTL